MRAPFLGDLGADDCFCRGEGLPHWWAFFFGCKRRGMDRIRLYVNQKRRTLARCAAVAGRLTERLQSVDVVYLGEVIHFCKGRFCL